MTGRAWAVLIATLLSLVWMAPAAHAAVAAPKPAGLGPARGVSYSIWTVNGQTVHLRFILPTADARGLVPSAKGRPDAASAATAVGAGVSVKSAGGDCPQIVQSQWVGKVYTLALTPGLFRYEIIFQCPSAEGLVLHDGVLFANVPGHINYARVQLGTDRPVLQTFTKARQDVVLPARGARLKGASVFGFVRQGAERLTGQADRLCVIGALLLLCRRWRDVGAIAAALGVGYFVALLVALNGILTIDPAMAGAVIGLLAALLGAAAIRVETAEPGSRGWRIGAGVAAGAVSAIVIGFAALRGLSTGLAAAGLLLFGLAQTRLLRIEPQMRWVAFAPAAVLGLVDGMGLARDLAQLDLAPLGLAPTFVAYDLGAVAAAAALAALAMAVLWLAARRLRFARGVAVDMAAASLVGVGLFWFVSRLYS